MQRLLVLAFAGLLTAGAAVAAPAARPEWPQAHSDLPGDPSVTFGVLPNGLRYALQRNATPADMVSMRLGITAGSMQEAPDQEGLAHLLEHMAFRGSKRLADGEAFRLLQRLGVRQGADANAFTTSATTLYVLDLPKKDEATVDAGLMLLREIAGDLTLDPKALDAERKVVEAEERSRAGPDLEGRKALARFEVGDHPYARPVSGLRDVIETAPVERLRDFYDAYYRPERAVLIIAGDIDPKAMEARLKATFSDWRGRGAPGHDPPPLNGDPGGPPLQTVAIDGYQASAIYMLWPERYAPRDPSRAEALRDAADGVALGVFTKRLMQQSDASGKPVASAVMAHVSAAGVATFELLQAGANLPSSALKLIVEAERQAAQFGVSQAEVDDVITIRHNQYANLAAAASTRSSPALANALLNDAFQGRVYLSPAQQLEIFDQAARGLTAGQVNARLRDLLGSPPAHIAYFGNVTAQVSEATLQRALADARGATVGAYAAVQAKPWTHTQFGPAGKVVERRALDDLGVTFVRFENGVRLTVKPTTFAKNQVQVKVRFGHGRLDQPRDHVSAAELSLYLWGTGGLKDLSLLEVGAALKGAGAIAFPSLDEDAFVLTNVGPANTLPTPSDKLGLEMQLMTAMVTDPGWRTDNWRMWIGSAGQREAAINATPGGVYGQISPQLLHSGDPRWGEASVAEQRTWQPQDAQAFLAPILDHAPIEVLIAGDVTVEAAIAAVGDTLGALPPRPEQAEPAGLRDAKFPAPTPTPVVARHKGRADQALVVVSWPATDFFADTRQTLAAGILMEVLRERAMNRMRTDQGKTYAVSAGTAMSSALPGYGRLGVNVMVQPQDVDGTFAALDAIAADIVQHPPTADEFARALTPQIEATRRTLANNATWLSLLSGAQTDPRKVAYLRSVTGELQSITVADLAVVARKWLVKDKAWRMAVLPEGDAKTQAAAN